MKKVLLTLLAAVFISASAFAQVELKINPIGLIFGGLSVSGEYIVNDNVGAELTGRFSTRSLTIDGDKATFTGLGLKAAGKYYLSPKNGGDKFYVSLYAKYGGLSGSYTDGTTLEKATATYSKIALGFEAGYKVVAESGFLFEIAFGIGRNLVENVTSSGNGNSPDFSLPFDLDGKLAIGWRF